MNKKWEYKEMDLEEENLEDLGKQGWELVVVYGDYYRDRDNIRQYKNQAILKRELNE